VVAEADNRDIFNPSTGLFSPVTVTKVQVGQLVYRIRLGVAGSGFPGVVSGWLPLAVASVPAGALTWDTVTLWDVRPLASDRWNAPFASSTSTPFAERSRLMTDTTTSAGHPRLYGQMDRRVGAYRAGGRILSDAGPYLDLADSQLPEPGYVLPALGSGFWNLWLAFPFGLPRWVRYSNAGGMRTPAGLRGIPILSNATARWDGTPISTGPALPTWTGLSGTASQAVLAVSGYTTTGPGQVILGMAADGEVMSPSDPTFDFGTVFTGINPLAPTTVASDFSTITWTNALQDGVTHPANARAVYLLIGAQHNVHPVWTSLPSADLIPVCNFQLQVSGPDGNMAHQAISCGSPETESYPGFNSLKASIFSVNRARVFRVPLMPNWAAPTTARTFSFVWYCFMNHQFDGALVQNVEADVIGWEIGP
jgi:hypothetical protein